MTAPATAPLIQWLRAWQRTVSVRQDLMSTRYDLDGALGAGQWGAVGEACRGLVSLSVTLRLLRAGVDLPAAATRRQQWHDAADLLAQLAPDLAERAWSLYLATVGTDEPARGHSRHVLAFVEAMATASHGPMEDAGIASLVLAWAAEAHALEGFCRRVGVPVSDAWYLSDPAHRHWYADVTDQVAKEQ
jgi:hypothetical protein